LIRVFGDNDQAINSNDQFDLIRVWHSKKPVDPKTGAKRPTIVNMSWGYAWYYNDGYTNNIISGINYRGVLHRYTALTAPQQQYGMQAGTSGIHCLRVASADAECTDCEKAGVVIVHSAGNYGNKVDVVGGKDYSNYYTTTTTYAGFIPAGQPVYYHQGGSPTSSNTVTVSAAWHAPVYSGNSLLETLGYYSERGPGCDVISPGSYITAATSKAAPLNYEFSPIGPYVFGKNSAADTSHYVCKISGTSMAAPNVTGVLALFLSQHPEATPLDAKKWIQNTGIKNQVATTSKDNDWFTSTALLGAPNNYLYNPYHSGYKDKL
jgi:hypothetical protein